MSENHKFIFDLVLARHEICNLESDEEKLFNLLEDGRRVVLFGRRNTGKTSLVVGKIIPRILEKHQNSLVLFIDFMGVETIEQIDRRVMLAFEKALNRQKSVKHIVTKFLKTMTKIRPTFELDPVTAESSFSLGFDKADDSPSFQDIFDRLVAMRDEFKIFIIMDEFQDISAVKTAEALFRQSLQNLKSDMPVLVLGSKKHMLAKIFAAPRAPLANWGQQIEISKITVGHYRAYLNARFNRLNKNISENVCSFLLEKMDFIPEAINIVSDWILRNETIKGEISESHIIHGIRGSLEERSPLFYEHLSRFTVNENTFLRHLADVAPLKKPHSADFSRKLRMSPGTLGPIVRRLEDQAIIYSSEDGYIFADPLLREFLKGQ